MSRYIQIGKDKYLIKELPGEFFKWQVEQRRKGVEEILKGSDIMDFGVHLPVMATTNTSNLSNTFCINLAAKGVGMVLKDGYMKGFTEECEEILKDVKGWKANERKRLEKIRELYACPEWIDRTALGTLEIFSRRTLSNLINDPRCSLLYTDLTYKGIVSYQVNCTAELHENDIFYRYVLALHDLMHLPSKIKPGYAYKLLVCEVYDKAPGRNASKRIV